MKMVRLVIEHSVRNLCVKPYPGHKHGCPNFGKRVICPPNAPLIEDILDLTKPTYIIFNKFDLGAHIHNMQIKHPDWSYRQLVCCLYWQGTARKQLKEKVKQALKESPGLYVLYCPEACGVNITATMKNLGIDLEWPPKQYTYQVAILGERNEKA